MTRQGQGPQANIHTPGPALLENRLRIFDTIFLKSTGLRGFFRESGPRGSYVELTSPGPGPILIYWPPHKCVKWPQHQHRLCQECPVCQ